MSLETFKKPEYPDTLKRKNWDKNKQILAKVKGFTGIGDLLEKLENQYNEIKWTEIFDLREIVLNKFGNPKDWQKNGFTAKKLDEAVRCAVAEVENGQCNKLRKLAYEVRDLAKKTAAEYDKNPLLKKSAQLCSDIATAADHFGVALNVNSMAAKIEESYNHFMETFINSTKKNLDTEMKRLVNDLGKGLQEVWRKPTPEGWKQARMKDRCRNITQIIGNAARFADLGFDMGRDVTSYKELLNTTNIKTYAQVEVPFDENTSAEDVKKHLQKLAEIAKKVRELF